MDRTFSYTLSIEINDLSFFHYIAKLNAWPFSTSKYESIGLQRLIWSMKITILEVYRFIETKITENYSKNVSDDIFKYLKTIDFLWHFTFLLIHFCLCHGSSYMNIHNIDIKMQDIIIPYSLLILCVPQSFFHIFFKWNFRQNVRSCIYVCTRKNQFNRTLSANELH